MASLKDAAERQAFSLAIDATLKSLNKDREKGLLNIVNLAQKFMGSNFRSEAYEGAKKMIQNPDSKWMRYVNRLLDETDPHVAKMTATEVEAAEKFTTIIAPTQTEQATAGTEVKTPFSLTKSYGFVAQIVTEAPVDMTITVYDSVGNKVQRADNPYQISSSSTSWEYEEGVYYFVDPVPNVDAGDYYYGITFSQSTKYLLYMYQYNGGAKISNANAVVTKGYTKKLSVTGAKVKAWKSKDSKIAKVDKNGKVTGVKAGKTTVYAVTEDGENLTCKVTVKENKFSSVKLSSSDVDYNKCVMEVYKASFDKSGNLVMTARIVNNTTDYITALKDVNIVVKDASGKTIGTYKTSRYNVTVSSYSTKDVKFTLKKSSLKKKKFDLRNATITRKGGAYYYR